MKLTGRGGNDLDPHLRAHKWQEVSDRLSLTPISCSRPWFAVRHVSRMSYCAQIVSSTDGPKKLRGELGDWGVRTGGGVRLNPCW
jgi:hypothetical protein